MARVVDIVFPFSADGNGRLEANNSTDFQRISLAIFAGDSNNAFQQYDIRSDQGLFSSPTEQGFSKLRTHIKKVFEEFKRLRYYELDEETIEISSENNNTVVSFQYFDIELGRIKTFSQRRFSA